MDSITVFALPKTPIIGPSIRCGDEKSTSVLTSSNPDPYGPYPAGHILVCILSAAIHSISLSLSYPYVPLILVKNSTSLSTIYVQAWKV